MSTENQYIEPGQNAESDNKSAPKKKRKSKKKASKKKPDNGLQKFINRIDTKKVKSTTGIILILLSFFFFLSSFSYLLTWQDDQYRVMNKGFFEFIFDGSEEPVANWLGKFGAWMSHLLIYKWFGVASFGIPLVLLVAGVKMVFDIAILPLQKTFSVAAVFTVWTSVLLGYFAESINYLGGAFGFQINKWFDITFGKFGSLILILCIGYILGHILFNVTLHKILAFFGISKSKETEDDSDSLSEIISEDDMLVRNVLTDEKTIQDDLSERVVLEEEENIVEESSIELESEIIEAEVKQEELSTEVPVDTNSENEFSVTVAEEDEVLPEKEVNSLKEEYGEYDPKLDLASYSLPPIDLLKDYGKREISVNKEELEDNKNKIVETLRDYKIEIKKIMATVGPTVTLYEIIPASGVRISKIKNLEDDIALSLAALGIRIIAPIPGKGIIGIEVPNSNPEMVSMRSLIASKKFQETDYDLPIVMGKTITNETFTFDLAKLPHLLVAGATGQGKSVGLNAILVSLLYKKHPSQVKFVLIDPKKVELTLFNKIERHFLAKLPDAEEAIITDVSKVVNTLNSLCIEMDDRYLLLKEAQVRNIKEYNTKFINRKLNPENGHKYLPYIVVLIDEFADLIMTAGKEVEHPIARIAQLARAVGIHLIVATQRPSVNVITGMIKANFPARMAFRVLSKIDSRTILDGSGADQLIGRGDMLISTGQDLVRLQCGFVDTPEVDAICDYIGDQRGYPDAFILPEYEGESNEGGGSIDDDDLDALFADAARIVVLHQQGSASLLQRKLKLGYNRAGRIVDQLEGMGIIGGFRGSKAREVLYADEQSLEELLTSKGII